MPISRAPDDLDDGLTTEARLNRRQLLKMAGGAVIGVQAVTVLGCGPVTNLLGDADGFTAEISGADGADADVALNPDGDATELADVNDAAEVIDAADAEDVGDAVVADADAVVATTWATGGTAAMTAIATYPNPFTKGTAGACDLTGAAILGPCHTASPQREDASEAWDGLPMRLMFRVVNAACEPLEDVNVEIWHTNAEGTYSGDIAAGCNDVEAYKKMLFFRGVQQTNTDGDVAFNTCYPGWYPGRAIHIHVRVMKGEYKGASNAAASITTQFYFADALTTDIFQTQPVYSDYGLPDTTAATDAFIPNAPAPYMMATERMSDGAMLASQTLIIA